MTNTFNGRVTIYTVIGCPYCMQAKLTLEGLGLPYTDVRLDLFPEIREEVMKRSNMRTVPQIYFNEILIGGNDDLNKLLQEKEHLEELLMKVRTAPVPEEGPIIPESSAPAIDNSDCICEPDDCVSFIKELKSKDFVGTHWVGFRIYRNAFTGKDFLTFGTKHKGLEESVVLAMGQALLDCQLIFSVNAFKVFSPTSEVYIHSIDKVNDALNSGPISNFVPKTGTELGEKLRKTILKLYAEFLSEDGKSVDYAGIKNSDNFQVYRRMTKELVHVNIENASREEKLSFFINIYNALVIHAVIEKGPPDSTWSRYKFFNESKYIIGGATYSLQDIENGILRANRRGVGQFSKPFGKNDPRLKVALDRHEPLVHFALVCGARSCPPIKTYTHQNIYKELQLATAAYLESDSGCQVDTAKQMIKLSSIFKWYQSDFGQDKYELIDFVLMYIPAGPKQKDIKSLTQSTNYSVQFLPYDWTNNSKM